MATPRTRRLIKVGDDSAHLNTAIRARRRLQKEAMRLVADIAKLSKRLEEVNEEEEVISAAIEQHAGVIVDAHKEPDTEPSEAEVSGSHS
jgi:signal transduction histidine kinase